MYNKMLLALATALVMEATSLEAAVPTSMSYQGRLMNNNLAVNTNVTMRFALYTAATDGIKVWPLAADYEQKTVAVDKGLYTAYIGSTTGMELSPELFGQDLWLQVWVDGTALTRTKISTTPYSYFAGLANNVVDNAITTDKILNGTIQGDDLATDIGINTTGAFTTTAKITGGDLEITGTLTIPDNSIEQSKVNGLGTALDAKANLAGATFTGAISGTTATFSGQLQSESNIVAGTDTAPGAFEIKDGDGGTVAIIADPSTADYMITLPPAAPTFDDQVMLAKTDGTTRWADPIAVDIVGGSLQGGDIPFQMPGGLKTNFLEIGAEGDVLVVRNSAVIDPGPEWKKLGDANIAANANIAATKLGTGVVDNTEFNVLNGITSTTAELNILDGVTADFNEINVLDGATAGTVEASKAVVVDGTKDITGFNSVTATTFVGALTGNATTATNITSVAEADNNKVYIGSNTGNTWGLIGNANIGDAANIAATKLGTGVVDNTEFNVLNGITSTTEELNILDGVTADFNEINVLDGATAGTVEASKAVVVNGTKDITGFRNVGIGGNLDVTGNLAVNGKLKLSYNSVVGTVNLSNTMANTSVINFTGATVVSASDIAGVTGAESGQLVYIINGNEYEITVLGKTVAPGTMVALVYAGTRWVVMP